MCVPSVATSLEKARRPARYVPCLPCRRTAAGTCTRWPYEIRDARIRHKIVEEPPFVWEQEPPALQRPSRIRFTVLGFRSKFVNSLAS